MIKNTRLNYRNTLARIESDCTFRVGFSSLMNNISCTKQSSLVLHFVSTSKRFSRSSGTLPCLSRSCLYIEDDRCLCPSTRTCKCKRVCTCRCHEESDTSLYIASFYLLTNKYFGFYSRWCPSQHQFTLADIQFEL